MTRDACEDVWRREAPHVLAALLRRSGDFESCEDAVQEALIAASVQWPAEGLPDNPRGWLIRVASRRLIDHQRSQTARTRRELEAAAYAPDPAGPNRPPTHLRTMTTRCRCSCSVPTPR